MQLGSASLDFASAAPGEPAAIVRAVGAMLSVEPALAPEDLTGAFRLAEALSRAFAAAARGIPIADRDVATINSHASDDLPFLRLGPEGKAARIAFDPIRAALAELARDGIETIARDRERLRVCAGADCGRVFLDRSRGKPRRWCSMQGCGNRAKVASFRRRAR